MERDKALEAAVSQIERQFGKGAIMKMGDSPPVAIDAVSTGALSLDVALGIGGLPRGRVCEVFGPESSGKTTLCYHVIAEAQRRGGLAAFIDAEHAMDPSYARRIGLNVDELLLSQPDNGEQALEIAELLIRSGALDVLVIDSVAALVPRAEIEGEMGDSHVGLQARLMSQALRKIAGTLNRTGTICIFTNQLREKIGVMFGSPETTPGGRALKFYSSVRLDIRRIETLKEGTEAVGNRVRVKVVKNKVAPPFKQAEFDIAYGEGISWEGSVLDVALEHKLIQKAGSYFSFDDERLGQGRTNVKAFLVEHPDVTAKLLDGIQAALPDTVIPRRDIAAGATPSPVKLPTTGSAAPTTGRRRRRRGQGQRSVAGTGRVARASPEPMRAGGGVMETVVVGLRRPRAGDPTVEVELESGERLRVHDRRLPEHGLAVGASLDPATRAALERAGAADAAERRSLRPDRPPAAVAGRALPPDGGVGDPAEDAAQVLERLQGMGVLDDAALASAVVSSRRARAYGRLRIESDLARLEVDPDVSAALAETSAGAEVDRARAALGSRHRRARATRRNCAERRSFWPGAASTARPSRPRSASTTSADRRHGGGRCPTGRSSSTIQASLALPMLNTLSCRKAGWFAPVRVFDQFGPHLRLAETARASARPGGRRHAGRAYLIR